MGIFSGRPLPPAGADPTSPHQMQEPERQSAAAFGADVDLTWVGVVGRGRLGTTLAPALRMAGYRVDGPARRGEVPNGNVLLLCVPDDAIADCARTVAGAAPLVGHTSGATPLTALEPAARAGAQLFGLHPLQTVAEAGASLHGCACAVAGSTEPALAEAERIARNLGMRPFTLRDDQRAAYHAAASIASNYLVTLQAAAATLAERAGIDELDDGALFGPLVRTTVENWISLGPADALTGPIVRGDEGTVRAQREAISELAPELVPVFDALADRTRALAAEGAVA